MVDPSHVVSVLLKEDVIPDVVPPAFLPTVLFTLVWPDGKEATLGNFLTREDTLEEPEIHVSRLSAEASNHWFEDTTYRGIPGVREDAAFNYALPSSRTSAWKQSPSIQSALGLMKPSYFLKNQSLDFPSHKELLNMEHCSKKGVAGTLWSLETGTG
ncbi:hypothetical protein C0992_009837 [Termitomyces sp. T32_za158]|nr:hypothetical protein C0992_009837 [Termitomyces sp. T32_za158]